MKRKGKVLGAFLLALILMLTMIPMASFAEDGDSDTNVSNVELSQQQGGRNNGDDCGNGDDCDNSECIDGNYSFTIKKELTVDSDPNAPNDAFEFKIYKKKWLIVYYWDKIATEYISVGNSKTLNLDIGTYKVKEIDNPQDDFTIVGESSIEVNNNNETVTFYNKYTNPEPPITTPGSLTISKNVYDSHEHLINVDVDDLFNITITGDASTGGYTTEVAIAAGGEITLSNLTPGNYTISEAAIENYEIPSAIDIEVDAGAAAGFTVLNIYLPDEPDPDPNPELVMTKTVAVYSGEGIPDNEAFRPSLALDELDKEVIYKIEIEQEPEPNVRISEVSTPLYRIDDLLQSPDGLNSVENDLLMEDQGGDLVTASSIITSFPDYFQVGSGLTFYYIDTCEDEGTYTNVAELYTTCPLVGSLVAIQSSDQTDNCNDIVASASAVVTVDLPEDPGDDDPPYNPPSSRDYNNVTYKANFPTGVVTSGSVPTDSSNYSDGGTVTVKDNSGTLTAEGYTFLGWDTLADGSGTDYVSADTFKIYNDVTLYAQWDPATEESTPSVETGTTPADPSTAVTGESNDLDPVPKTGDNTPIMALTLLGLLSAGAAIYLMRRREA